jgi:hypothetical protein
MLRLFDKLRVMDGKWIKADWEQLAGISMLRDLRVFVVKLLTSISVN